MLVFVVRRTGVNRVRFPGRPLRILLIALLVVGLSLVPAAAAQTETATPASPTSTEVTGASESNRSVVGSLPGDPAVTIVSYSYDEETERMTISLSTDEYRGVTVTATDDDSTGLGTGYVVSRELTTEDVHQIQITAPSGEVSISTGPSMEDGKFGTISADDGDGGQLLSGSPGPGDKLWSGIGAGLGTAFGALAVVVKHRLGLHRGMERKA